MAEKNTANIGFEQQIWGAAEYKHVVQRGAFPKCINLIQWGIL